MIYIHKLESVLSSIFRVRGSFSLSLPQPGKYHGLSSKEINAQEFSLYARLHVDRITRCNSDHRHSHIDRLPGLHRHSGAWKSNEGHEQPSPTRDRDADVHE